MAVNKYILELFPVSGEAWELYEKKFHELFPHTSHLANGTTIFYKDDEGNAGVDLYTNLEANVEKITLLDMGVKARMRIHDTNRTVHYWMPPRSSIWKNGVTLANSIGVIDSSYRGNLMAAVSPLKTSVIERGTRLVQIVAPDMGSIVQIHLCPVSLIDSTSRGEGGFGSTGK